MMPRIVRHFDDMPTLMYIHGGSLFGYCLLPAPRDHTYLIVACLSGASEVPSSGLPVLHVHLLYHGGASHRKALAFSAC